MSIATQIGRIAKAKKDIKEVVNQDFEIINNETIDEYAEKMESAYDEYESYIPWEHGEGSEFTFKKGGTGSYLKELEINGNTHQTTIAAETGKEVVGTSINVNDVNIEKENYVTLKGNTHQGRLPSEYTQVDYIESSGTQYIDTGININTTTSRYETKINPSSVSGTMGIFGTRNYSSANQSSMNVFIISGTFRLDWLTGNGNYNVRNISSDTEYTISITRGLATINNINHTSTETTSIDSTYPFYIGSFNNVGSVFSTGFSGKIYYSKLYNNNILVFDGVPCYRKSDNEVGMYDLVSNTFFTNQGTGTFTYGSIASIAPTPDSPIDIEVVTGDNTIHITGKNLLDKANNIFQGTFYTSSGGEDSIVEENVRCCTKKINISGKTGSLTYSGQYFNLMSFYDSNNTLISYAQTSTASIPAGATSVRLRFYNNDNALPVSTLQALNLMLENNSSATTYEPYHTPQNYPINLGTIELCKIGNYQDYIYKDNGKWYLHKEIGKVNMSDISSQINPVTNFQDNFNSTNGIISLRWHMNHFNERNIARFTTFNCFSNKLKGNFTIKWNNVNQLYCFGDIDGLIFGVLYTDIGLSEWTSSAINDLETRLNTYFGDTYFYLVLATPTNTEITDTTLISQLNALYTAQIYNPTFIETTTSNLLPYINLKYNVVTPSPSPERPSDIEVVSGDNVVNVHGKNLYYIEPQTKNGVTLSYDSDGAIVLNGTSNASFIQFHNVISLSGRNTLSVTNPTIQNNTFVRTRNESGILVHSITLENTALKTATKNGNIKTLEITIGAKDVVYNNFKIYAQLEQGSVASTYEPYQSKDYEIDLHGKNLLPNSESLSNTGQYQDVIRFTDLEPSTKYTLKVKGTAGDKFYTGGSMPYSSLTIPSNGILEFTFTTNSTISDVAIIKNTTATNTLPLTECTLCKGSTAIEYEEFYDYKLCKIGDYKDKIDKSTGKNLFNKDNITSIINGSLSNDVIVSNAISVDYGGVSANINSLSLNAGTYYISMKIKRASGTNTYNINRILLSGINSSQITMVEKPTLSGEYQIYTCRISLSSSTNITSIGAQLQTSNNSVVLNIKDIMVSTSSDTSYEPYGKQWYIEKNIGKVVLNGSETYWTDTPSGFTRFGTGINDLKKFSSRNINGILSTHFIPNINNNLGIIYSSSVNLCLYPTDTTITTPTDFKTWLSTHNTIVYYPLETPTYEIITNETLINQLEELTKLDTYNNYSAVTATGDLINPELECVLFSQPAYQK